MMLTLVHGGMTGVDRGAHEAAIANGWLVAGYMPGNARDEYGAIPADVARCLIPHASSLYVARTAANVRCCDALLVIVRDAADPRATPGTTKTIDLATDRYLRRMVIDPNHSPNEIAVWIWRELIALRPLPLPLEPQGLDPVPARLMVAGPRESKWPGARATTADLLQRVGAELTTLNAQRSAVHLTKSAP